MSLLPQTKSVLKELVSGSGRSGDDCVIIESSGIRYESSACKDLLQENYDQVCLTVLNLKSIRSLLVNSAMVKLFPRLAAFNKSIFTQKYY